ncbi:tRNA 2-thiocytidine biosynthesis protein ttca [Plakobranchus ocellatus]|uniref:tRNA 2-thiocytidine biosynthesis protein ttca n=1 Tax=Plakobranchus ocellatus TaxID=259542 RepID=A0AAV4C2S5_9GAST|nr:tRNA 2-thiocytidine biosynthesis protein ttca [Plakobranchus ocellatus]
MKAKEIFDNAKKLRLKVPDQTALFDKAARPYRWFVLPSEASACLLHHQGSSSTPVPPRVAQDDLPFFPGRKIHREMRSNDQPDGLAEDSLQAGKVLYSEFKSPEQSVNADFQAVDLSKRTVDLGKNCDGTANNTGVTVSESAGESSRMLALENAVKYADTLLASSGLTVMTSEVSSVMNSIWERFDPKTDCKQEAEGPTATKSALDEVSSTLNQIWDSFTVKTTENSGTADNLVDPTSVRTASAALNDVADSADELPEASVLTETESWSAESQEGSVVTSALDEINAGLKQIWQGFIPQTPKPGEAMADTSLGTESHRGSTENSAWVNSDLHSSEMSYVEEVNVASASGEISSMMSSIWKQFTPEAGKNGPGTGAKPSETDVAEPRLGVSDVTGTSCNLSTEPRLGVSDVTNTCNSSSEPRLGESNVADSSAQNNLVSGNNENRMNPSLSNIKSDDFVKKDVGPEHDSKLSDTKGNSQSASFSQGGSDIIKSDDFVKEDVGPEHDSKLSETKGNSQLAREESLEIKVNAGQIKDNLPPEKTKTGLNGQLNTKSFVSAQEEIQNAINEIWEYFTPKQSRSIKEDTGVGQDLSNSKVGKAKDATVCDVTNGMNEIEKNFTNKNVNGNRALESTIIIDKTSHEATEFSGISESAKDKNKRAQQIVRELSELSKQGSNSLLERKADGNVALDSTGHGTNEAQEEVKNFMSQIWESFGVKNGRISSEELSRAEGVCEGVRSCVDATADIRDSQNGGGSSNVTTSDQGLINADQTHPAVLGIPPGWSNSGHCTRMSTQGSAREGSASFAEGMIQALTQGFGDLAVDYSGEGDQQEQGASFGILSEKICAPLQQTVTQDSKTDRDPVRSNTVKDGDLRKNITHGEICAGQEEWTLNTGPDLSKPLQKPVTEPDAAPVCSLIKQKGRQTETVKLKTSEVSAEPGGNSCETRTAVRWFAPPKQIFKPTVTALEEYGMLGDGDKVLVCLSGGKDSLSLLHTIRQYQFYAMGKGIKFEFGAVTVDPMTPAYDPSPLKQYLASLGVPYFYESQSILETAEQLPYECASICSFCSRMKRGRIYAAARREGYNVLALGQHLDDLAESFLMSFFHNGNLNTMKAHYTVKQGDLRVIRPFVYVREADLRAFAEQRKLPIIAENCPACFEAPKERHRTKQLLAAQEVMFPQVYSSMMAALRPLMARQITNKSSTVLEEEED